MSSPLEVTPESLLRHAGQLAGVADVLDTAGAVRSAPEDYGQLCAFVPGLLDRVREPLVATVVAAARSVRETGEALTDVATGYRNADAFDAGE